MLWLVLSVLVLATACALLRARVRRREAAALAAAEARVGRLQQHVDRLARHLSAIAEEVVVASAIPAGGDGVALVGLPRSRPAPPPVLHAPVREARSPSGPWSPPPL